MNHIIEDVVTNVSDQVIIDLLNAPKTCSICGRVAKIINNDVCIKCWEAELDDYYLQR